MSGESAGKRLLAGLHGGGKIVARGAGTLVDGMTGGSLHVSEAIGTFADGVGLAYAEMGALPDDSPEVAAIRATQPESAPAERKGDAVFDAKTVSRRAPPPPKPVAQKRVEAEQVEEVAQENVRKPAAREVRARVLPKYAGAAIPAEPRLPTHRASAVEPGRRLPSHQGQVVAQSRRLPSHAGRVIPKEADPSDAEEV